MVGVAYLSPDPESPNFISVGQRVEAGQTLLLIEAMKTFNQIKAPRAGTVSRVLINSGSPVEFGEVLVIVD
jgi:acetyl-CoA carboxylase biotin carboxyl carrier protein